MKKYALYLPQFHEFEDNNRWWGKGYTEWNNVKRAKKIFTWHQQPKIPLDGYYDLSDAAEMGRQFNLAQKSGIDAFAVYSYWSNGAQLMEDPIENILNDQSINFKFYLTWGNHDFYNKIEFRTKKLLWKQFYSFDRIEKQAEHLVRVMDDQRYERALGRPIFAIYDAKSIPNFPKYIQKLKDLVLLIGGLSMHVRICVKDHKDVLFCKKYSSLIDSTYEYQPFLSFHRNQFVAFIYANLFRLNKDLLKKTTVISAQLFMRWFYRPKRILSDHPHGYGCYTGWDTTPRWGKVGIIHRGFNADIYIKQLSLIDTLIEGNDFMVITAWNEWGEGATLERDQFNDYLTVLRDFYKN